MKNKVISITVHLNGGNSTYNPFQEEPHYLAESFKELNEALAEQYTIKTVTSHQHHYLVNHLFVLEREDSFN